MRILQWHWQPHIWIIAKLHTEATSSSCSPSSPKEQPQSLSSSSGNESLSNAVAGDGIDNKSLTNGKTDDTEPPYQNADALRTSQATSNDVDYENAVQTDIRSNGSNGDANSSTVSDNNNVVKNELVNGNSTDADKKLMENDSAKAAHNKEELYDVPVGECLN